MNPKRNWISVIESILFIAEKPVTVDRLKEVFADESPTTEELGQFFRDIQTRYQNSDSGFELREAQGGFQFTTKTENAEFIRKYLQTKPFRLGRSALETLSIVAYRQPITRSEIDQIRGIDSSHLLRTLIERGLVRMAGKAEIPGRPVQYGTTPKFLETVGLAGLQELPPLSELEEIQGDTEDPQKKLEEGLERFLHDRSEEQENNDAGNSLGEIEQLIDSAGAANREIYASALHGEIAQENKLALESLQALKLRPKKKPQETMTWEELTHGNEAPAVANAAPDDDH